MIFAFAPPAGAHGFGQRYDLPLPLSLYLYGTAAVVVASFLMVSLFLRRPVPEPIHRQTDLLAQPLGKFIAHAAVIFFLKLAAAAVFVVVVIAGLIGNQNPYRNIAPTMVWIIVWVGFAYVSAFVGDLWALINPWRTIFGGAQALLGQMTGRRDWPWRLLYPERLGVWPAVVLLLAFAWIELVYPTPAVPAQIACLAIGYSILTFIGMAAFGRDTWLRHGEVFSVVFGAFARFAPLQARAGERGPELTLQPFGAGLLRREPASPSMVAFVLLLLSTVLFDGLLNTPEWSSLETTIRTFIRQGGDNASPVIRTAALVAFWLLLLTAYLVVCGMMSAATGRHHSGREIAQLFAFTLIPIAIGYHVAHYLVFLLIQGQYIIPLISDPFGWGWNLFGTAGYRVDIAIVGARFAWYTAVLAILAGHVIAVYLAHAVAMRHFTPRDAALRSQVPLTALMVIYTFVSLSILAEPIVERQDAAQPSAVRTATGITMPADTLRPEPGTGRLQPVGADQFAKAKLTYRVLGSAFHDGTRTSVADLLYAYIFAYRWGVRSGPNDAHYDSYVDSTTAPLRQTLIGLRAAGSDPISRSLRIGDVNFVRELFAIEIYTSSAPPHPERHATPAPPWSTLPWHLIVLMEEAVARGWGAFSQAEAARRDVAWLDVVRSEKVKTQLASLVETFGRDGYRPETLQAFVSAEDARKRWTALAHFYKTHGHFLVTNGPYELKRFSTEGIALQAFRDLTYPLGVGSYDAYATPRRAYITSVEQETDRLRLSGDIESIVRFARSQRIERIAIRTLSRELLKQAAPECRYVVADDTGRVVFAGSTALDDTLTFPIDLKGRLPIGQYTIAALIAVNGNVMNAEIRRFRTQISPN